MDMDLAERGGVEWVSKFCPVEDSNPPPPPAGRRLNLYPDARFEIDPMFCSVP